MLNLNANFWGVCFLELFIWVILISFCVSLFLLLTKVSLVPLYPTMEVIGPPANEPILSSRQSESFRHLELRNLSIISDFLDMAGLVLQFWRRRRNRRSIRSRGTFILENISLCLTKFHQ